MPQKAPPRSQLIDPAIAKKDIVLANQLPCDLDDFCMEFDLQKRQRVIECAPIRTLDLRPETKVVLARITRISPWIIG